VSAPPALAVVGPTSGIGQDLIELLGERRVPLSRLKLLVSQVDERQIPDTPDGVEAKLDLLSPEAFDGVDIAVFADEPDIARRFSQVAAAAGAAVLDVTGGTAAEPGVALVAPGVTPPSAIAHAGTRLALPPAAAGALVAVLAPLHAAARIRRVVISLYEAAATGGQGALDELMDQVRGLLTQQEVPTTHFPEQLAFNVLPYTGRFTESGDTEPEIAIGASLRRLLDAPTLGVAVTAARVSAFHGTSASVHVELEGPLEPADAARRLAAAPGVEVVDAPGDGRYPVGLEAAGQEFVLVGRIRADRSVPHGLALWLAADDVRRSAVAALEVVQALSARPT
jgi:aspartate-semialdehyde dehydrogenase